MTTRPGRRRVLSAFGALAAAASCPVALAQVPARRVLNTLVAPPGNQASLYGSPVQGFPVVDFHTHLQRAISAEELIRRMDLNGVTRVVLMPLYYGDVGGSVQDGEGSDEQALEYARRYPERFVPFVGMQRPDLNDWPVWGADTDVARRLLADTERKLASGEFFGMGEIMLRFYPYTNRFGIRSTSDMNYRADSPLMRKLADLSAKYKAPMVIHAEAEPEVAERMQRLLEQHPQAIVVWSHNCGRSSAEAIDRMFQRHRNLYADLGGMVYSGPEAEHYGRYYPRRTPWMHLVVNEHGGILPEMKPILVRHAERFVIGTDIAHARVWQIYYRHWPRWWHFFDQLPIEAVRKIAFANAERLFRPA